MSVSGGLAFVGTAVLIIWAIACGGSKQDAMATPIEPVVAIAAATPTAIGIAPIIIPIPTMDVPLKPTTVSEAMADLFPFTVVDSDGQEITFDKPPDRIVALDSAAVEILFAIGEGHRVVATHNFVSYPSETVGISRVGDAYSLNLEAIVALNPDLVFVFSEGAVPDLERAGVKVLYLKSLGYNFRKVADNVRLWGNITGNVDAAEVVASRFEARVSRIEWAMAKRGNGPSVFQDEGDLWTSGSDTLIGGVFDLLKLRNIAHDVSGYAQLSPEIIIERDPEVVIASYEDTISGAPAFKDLSAVKSNRVFVPSSDALSIASPRFVGGIEEMAKWIYPGILE